jgi:general secretion pathway protein J
MVDPRRQSGFTLLELLVVIAILGLIVVALGHGVRFAGQAWQRQERDATRAGDRDAVRNILRQMIASGTGFEGAAGSLRFVSRLPDALQRGGLYEVELSAGASGLILAWKPHFRGPDDGAAINQTPLAKDVTGLAFAYYAGPAGWQPAHSDKAIPPSLIRIGFRLADGSVTPAMVVAPMVEIAFSVPK